MYESDGNAVGGGSAHFFVDKTDPDTQPKALFREVPPCLRDYFGRASAYCCWAWVSNGTRWTKEPKQPKAGDRNAKSSDESTWGDMTAAVMRANQMGWGVGIMIARRKDFACIDLDNVIDADGKIAPSAAEIITRAGSYSEVSPSGSGVKIFGVVTPGTIPAGPHKLVIDGGEAELFHNENRYLCVTGIPHGDNTKLSDITDLVVELHAEAVRQKAAKTEHKQQDRKRHTQKQEERASEATATRGTYFRNVNDAALEDIGGWVQKLFPNAVYQPGTGAWRVNQSHLGTAYEEDLSIHPRGIQNYGPEHAATAIDLVMEFGGAPKPVDAADWLCQQMGLDPYSIGKQRRKQQEQPSDSLGEWQYQYNKNGQLLCTVSNVRKTIMEFSSWRGVFRFNEFSMRAELGRPIPMPDGKVPNDFEPREIIDSDILDALCVFQNSTYPRLAKSVMADTVEAVARLDTYNPLQDYLNSLHWDGKPRLSSWLVDYANADLTQHKPDYVAAVGQKWMISAVARAMRPGCKADAVLVMIGDQGVGKSSTASILAGDWFSDSLPPVDSKDAADHLRGKWIVEIPEMSTLDKATVEATKAFLSKTEENFRPAYGIKPICFKRSCVFFGSTNQTDGFLRDSTGNRRFWPIVVGAIDLAGLKRDRNQLWAEALHYYRAGATWHMEKDLAPLAADEAAVFVTRDDREEVLWNALKSRQTVTTLDCCNILEVTHDVGNQRAMARMLRSLGWKDKRNKGRRWWERASGDA